MSSPIYRGNVTGLSHFSYGGSHARTPRGPQALGEPDPNNPYDSSAVGIYYDDNMLVEDKDGDVSSGMVFYVLPIELSVQDEKATSEPVAPRKTRTLAFL